MYMDYIIQYNYFNYMNYADYLHLLLTKKGFYYNKNYNNDLIYKHYLINKFSDKFASLAKPIIISYYDCFARLIQFERELKKYGYELWSENIYYAFWKAKNLIELKT